MGINNRVDVELVSPNIDELKLLIEKAPSNL